MRATALVVVALGACSAPVPSSLPAHTTQPRAAPGTPPPEVTFTPMRLEASRLPAVAADGSVVVHTVIDGDGGRGNPNLAIAVKDRRDHELERIVVATANETEGQYDERGPSPALAAKLAAANTRLVDLHATRDLRQLTGDGLAVTLGQRLAVHVNGTLVVDIATPASWSIPDRKLCTTCEELCRHPMLLEGAYADVAHRLVLVVVAYTGTDLCPDPVSQHHVITW